MIPVDNCGLLQGRFLGKQQMFRLKMIDHITQYHITQSQWLTVKNPRTFLVLRLVYMFIFYLLIYLFWVLSLVIGQSTWLNWLE